MSPGSSSIRSGQGFRDEETIIIFSDVDSQEGVAVFEEWEGHQLKEVHRVGTSETIGEYTVEHVLSRDVTGLREVTDPGYLPVIIALILVTGGLSLTFIQKIGDNKL